MKVCSSFSVCKILWCKGLPRPHMNLMWHRGRAFSYSAVWSSRTGHHHPSHHQYTNQDFLDLLNEENKERAKKKLQKVKPVRSVDEVELKKDARMSAVLVPLCLVNNEPSLLFTLRSHKLTAHRGDVSFPGGNCDETDRDFAHTALRETEEELGIDPSVWEVWGQMQPVPSSNRKGLVHPVLASTGDLDVTALSLSPEEVSEVFTVPLSHLCHPQNVGATQFRLLHGYTLPVYHRTRHRIWGLTAIIVHLTLNILAPNLYHYKLKHRKSMIHATSRSNGPR